MSAHFVDVKVPREDVDLDVTVELRIHKEGRIEGIGTPPVEVSVGRIYCAEHLTEAEEEEAADLALEAYRQGRYE